jgi:hypothetical protein
LSPRIPFFFKTLQIFSFHIKPQNILFKGHDHSLNSMIISFSFRTQKFEISWSHQHMCHGHISKTRLVPNFFFISKAYDPSFCSQNHLIELSKHFQNTNHKIMRVLSTFLMNTKFIFSIFQNQTIFHISISLTSLKITSLTQLLNKNPCSWSIESFSSKP